MSMQIHRCSKGSKPDPDFSYNGVTGRWWQERARNSVHQRAYKNVADFIHKSLPRAPKLIVDYACGAGDLLSLLSRQFPDSRLIGLDGSSLLLDLAEKRLSGLPPRFIQRISLIETLLPRRNWLGERADLAVYCFPNMTPASAEEQAHGTGFAVSQRDSKIAQTISEATEPGGEDYELPDPEAIQQTLEYGRSISRNLRQLLRRDGICIRVEYATTRRHLWTPLELLQVSFEEGSLEGEVAGIKSRPWFRVLASAYFRSQVLEDVHQQTGDERDRNGGYLITVLRAL